MLWGEAVGSNGLMRQRAVGLGRLYDMEVGLSCSCVLAVGLRGLMSWHKAVGLSLSTW